MATNIAQTTQVRIRRGTTELIAGQVVEGEPFYDLDVQRMGIGGGSQGVIQQWKSQFLEFKADVTGSESRDLRSKLMEIPSLADLGVFGNGEDETTKIQQAFTDFAGKVLKGEPGKTYRCSATITSQCTFIGQGCKFEFHGSVIENLFHQTGEGDFIDTVIDGDNVASCKRGFFLDCDYAFTRFNRFNPTIKNIKNNNNTQSCSAFEAYLGTTATNTMTFLKINCIVDGVTATSNGVVGDDGGKATGILININKTGSYNLIDILDCPVSNVSSGGSDPSEDADGIHSSIAGFTTSVSTGAVNIRNCVVSGARKRGYKIQSANTTVENSICYGSQSLAGFETYALNTVFTNCKLLDGSGIGFTTEFPGTIFNNCYAESSSTSGRLFAIYDNADNAQLYGCTMSSTGTLTSTSVGVMQVYEADNVIIRDCVIENTQDSGSSIFLEDSATITINGSRLSGSDVGINFSTSTGRVIASDTLFSCSVHFVTRSGNGIQAFYARDCRFEGATSTGLNCWNSAGANSMYAEVDNCSILTNGGGGAWLAPGSRATNNRIENQGSIGGLGIYLPGNESTAVGNRMTNFDTGILASFGINQVIANNVTDGCTAGYDLTGSTPLLNDNNVSM